MAILRSWAFVNFTALLAGIVALASFDVPAKIAAEPNLVGILGLPLLVAAGVWLLLAVLRRCLPVKP